MNASSLSFDWLSELTFPIKHNLSMVPNHMYPAEKGILSMENVSLLLTIMLEEFP